MSIRLSFPGIRNLFTFEDDNTMIIHVLPPEQGTEQNPIPVDICHDLEAARRTTTGVCPVHGSYAVYEEYHAPQGWVPIGMKQRNRWVWGKDTCNEKPKRSRWPANPRRALAPMEA